MHVSLRTLAAAGLVVLAAIPAGFAQSDHAGHGADAGNGAVIDAYNAANARMMDGIMTVPSGDADRDFATMMIPHHQGAIDMARIQLEFGKDPALRAMAEAIIGAQEAEIAELKAWLAKNGS